MIRDLLEEVPEPHHRSDVCIIGAGAAGIVLALELVRRGKTVTLLEGGGRSVEEASQAPYASETDALAHRGLHGGRVRALGGTTTLWGGQILELDALDFEPRPWVAESGWPFPKQELAPHYARALELEGVAGSLLNDNAVWAAVGEKLPHFAGLNAYVSRWCPEANFARLHAKTLEQSVNVQIWVHANAVEMLMQDGAATGIRCRTLTGIESTFTAVEYVFCLGAIESSRFFLQPRNGRLPWNDSGLLGRHFQDHIDCNAAMVEPQSLRHFHQLFDAIFYQGHKYNPKLKLDETTQRTEGLLNAGATFFSVSNLDETLAAMKTTAKQMLRGRLGDVTPSEAWRLIRNSPTLLRQSYRYAVEHRAYHPAGAQMMMRVHCEQEPASASAISLSGQRDQLGLLKTRLSWRISDLELATIARFVQIVRHALEDIATIAPDPALIDGNHAFVDRCEDSYHHMGGMRMHHSAQCGVVDPTLKLHGTNNVYICSSAVFPTSGFSNPTHTLVALAVRLAQHLT